MTIAFGVSLFVVVAGIVFCSRRGNPVSQDAVAWTIAAIVYYALLFWPGPLQGV
jgi:hypothetical protein